MDKSLPLCVYGVTGKHIHKKKKSPNSGFSKQVWGVRQHICITLSVKTEANADVFMSFCQFLLQPPPQVAVLSKPRGEKKRALLELSIAHSIRLFTCPWNWKPHITDELPTMEWNRLLVKLMSWTLDRILNEKLRRRARTVNKTGSSIIIT